MVVYVAALILCGASLVVGEALLRGAGYSRGTKLAGPVGLSALIVVATACASVGADGRVIAGAMVVLTVTAAARLRTLPRPDSPALAVTVIVAAATAVPFLVNARWGVLGVTINDDPASHFAWTDAIAFGHPVGPLLIDDAYPLGPHAVAAGLTRLLGSAADGPFQALVVAAPILTAIAALGALRHVPPAPRVAGASLVALSFLAAAFFAEASYKEPLLSLLVVGLAVALRELTAASDWRARRAVPVGMLLAGSLLIYGSGGALWPLATLGAWAVAELVARRMRPTRDQLRTAVRFLACGLAVAIAGTVVRAGALLQSNLGGGVRNHPGNVPTELPVYQGLGLWLSGQFQFLPTDLFRAGMLSAFAAAVFVYSAGWWLRRRDLAIPAAVAACLLLYAVTRQTTSPYITAKSLAIAAPLVMLMIAGALLRAPLWPRRGDTAGALRLAAAGAFLAVAVASSALVLRSGPIGPTTHTDDLAAIRAIVGRRPTAFVVRDTYSGWKLHGGVFAAPQENSVRPLIAFAARPEKPVTPGQMLDFDSLDPSAVDRFEYLVATRSAFASTPPPNWRLVTTTRWYELWRRDGPTAPRSVLSEAGAPGAVLDCANPALPRRGDAWVRPAPVLGPAAAWRGPGDVPSPGSGAEIYAHPGDAVHQTLALPAGRWDLSLQYRSHVAVRVFAAASTLRLPANLDIVGSFWSAGTITPAGGPVVVTLRFARSPAPPASRTLVVGVLAATRADERGRLVALRRACGRYVDWYAAR